MIDPRIIPDEELARDLEYAKRALRGEVFYTPSPERILALAEQVQTAYEDGQRMQEAQERAAYEEAVAHAEEAEAERDNAERRIEAWQKTAVHEKARADAAVQRLADRDKAIRDLADGVMSKHGDRRGWHHAEMRELAIRLRALLNEEGGT